MKRGGKNKDFVFNLLSKLHFGPTLNFYGPKTFFLFYFLKIFCIYSIDGHFSFAISIFASKL